MAKNMIRQEIIDNLPEISIMGMNAIENDYVNGWIKYALQYAKDYNNSNEVGIMLNKSNWNIYDIVVGKENYVKYNIPECKEERNGNLILIHNHPSNHIFSDRDIYNFCKTQAVNVLIAAGNKGSIYALQELRKFDKYKTVECYLKETDKNKSIWSREKILDHVLHEYQSVLNVHYVKEEMTC